MRTERYKIFIVPSGYFAVSLNKSTAAPDTNHITLEIFVVDLLYCQGCAELLLRYNHGSVKSLQ